MKLRILIRVGIVFIFATAVLLFFLSQPVDSKNKAQHLFVVAEGQGVNAIGKNLEEAGLIRNRFVFIFDVRRLGLAAKIQAGDFRVSKNETPAQIAKDLTTGTLDRWVQIIEGLRSDEIAEILKGKIPTYENSWALELRKHEGYLFPDTYLVPKDADIELVLKILADNFDKKTTSLQTQVGKNGLTFDQSIILASIIEREALFDEDRPVVAGILLNRLNAGIALQIDATIQYALGYQPEEKDWWKKSITKDDLQVRSAYNTYQRPGLPPKPICNPGLSAIKAALNPTDTNYLYYVSDKKGHLHYAQTLDEHNANIAKYL